MRSRVCTSFVRLHWTSCVCLQVSLWGDLRRFSHWRNRRAGSRELSSIPLKDDRFALPGDSVIGTVVATLQTTFADRSSPVAPLLLESAHKASHLCSAGYVILRWNVWWSFREPIFFVVLREPEVDGSSGFVVGALIAISQTPLALGLESITPLLLAATQQTRDLGSWRGVLSGGAFGCARTLLRSFLTQTHDPVVCIGNFVIGASIATGLTLAADRPSPVALLLLRATQQTRDLGFRHSIGCALPGSRNRVVDGKKPLDLLRAAARNSYRLRRFRGAGKDGAADDLAMRLIVSRRVPALHMTSFPGPPPGNETRSE